MPTLFNHFRKIGAGLSGMVSKIPVKETLSKGTKTAALISSILLAGKLGHHLYKKIGEKVDDSVTAEKKKALSEIRETVRNNLKNFILECIIRWLTYILLIMLAYFIARIYHLHKDILVAFVILGIYSFYAIKIFLILRWFISFCRTNGLIFNPVKIIRAYLYRSILDRVKRTMDNLPLPHRLAMDFFGPSRDKIADDIATISMQSPELRREALTRIGMWLCGWAIYILIYENLFLYVTGIDFKVIWEPLIWPFYTVFKFLSVN